MRRESLGSQRRGARPNILALAVSPLAMVVASCGGGGSGGGAISLPAPAPAPSPTPVPSPTPTPTPVPTPTPTPPPTNFDTSEFRRSDGPGQHGAVTAWQAGSTGAGQTIAIIDTGIDVDSPEFAGRILAASRDVTDGGRSVDAFDDHGTNVALVAAGARNGTGILGMAFDAPLLVLRADEPGSCPGTGPTTGEPDCTFLDSAIARGVDAAVAGGARVINISLGGDGGITNALRDAVARASAAGVVVIVAAGNGGDGGEPGVDPGQPSAFAAAVRAAGGNNVIIVGSVDEGNAISSFSQRAGAQAAWYLTARGERVCCVYENGRIFVGTDASGSFNLVFSGTSFAAPQVSGAVALLAQAFPNLTGQQIVRLLLDSARDAGATGVDNVYGTGILDIASAMAPRGALSMPGSTSVVRLGADTAVASPAMGDALATAGPLTSIVLDSYARAYTVDIGAGMRGAALENRLGSAMATGVRNTSVAAGGVALAFSVSDDPARPGATRWSRELRLTGEQAEGARLLAARVISRIAPGTEMAFGLREGSSGLAAGLQGARQPAFLIAGEARGDTGFARAVDGSFAVRHSLGATGLTVSADTGSMIEASRPGGRLAGDPLRLPSDVRSFSFAADRSFGPVAATFGATVLDEARTVLGGQFAGGFGEGGARTLFLDASAGWDIAGGWRLGAAWRQGHTRASSGGAIDGNSNLRSNGWSVDLSRAGAFAPGDSFGFRLSQPLRVTGGGLMLNLPVSYDYATLEAGYAARFVSLAPSGREIDGELAWRGPLWGGNAAASLFYRKDPGHYAAVPDDKGVAVKWEFAF